MSAFNGQLTLSEVHELAEEGDRLHRKGLDILTTFQDWAKQYYGDECRGADDADFEPMCRPCRVWRLFDELLSIVNGGSLDEDDHEA